MLKAFTPHAETVAIQIVRTHVKKLVTCLVVMIALWAVKKDVLTPVVILVDTFVQSAVKVFVLPIVVDLAWEVVFNYKRL